ncbi:hypothetical protein K2173_000688 [Erythroxylum novogranatense]|uniref:Uncharacterized protein n=1 Tax=Erythroxylum novogranatense TaxID=1862640 RepID=A0AAV8SI60_9ROSI|nr:hypothetical protein K2173_000688 [Erythroxylum novogranatense]
MENNTNNTSVVRNTSNNNNASIVSLENLNNVANWVSASVISAFFSSLERFSCVNVATTNDDDSSDDEANDRPLTLSTNPCHSDDVSALPV